MSLFSFEYLKWNSSWLILNRSRSFLRFHIKPFFWPQSMIDLMNQVLHGKLLKVLSTENNNYLYPKCLIQVNFENKFQIHLDPFRSPPTKVRVGDRDQRVWNDDDDLVADDLDAIDSDDSNGDQESPFSLENSPTRSTRRQVCVSI